MNFVVLRSEGTMSIDNASVELDTTSWLGPEVEIFAWHGDAGNGFIEYNDRPRVVSRIEDLAPYQALVNAWIDAASREPQPLRIEQARQIKVGLVDALYNNKVRVPYTHWDGWQYDARDEAIGFMAATAAAFGLPRRIDEEFVRFIGNTGTRNTINFNVYENVRSANAVNAWSETMHNNWRDVYWHRTGYTWSGAASPAGSGVTLHTHAIGADLWTWYVAGYVTPGAGGFEPMDYFNPISVASGGTSLVRWQPLNSPAQTDVNADEFKNALQQIIARRTALNHGRVARRGHIQSLNNIPDVIAYDVVAGW